MEVNVNQKPAYRHRLVHGYRPGQGVRVLTRAGDSGPAAKAEVFHLVLDIGVKCDVDDEGDEGDEGGNERDEGCEEGNGDVLRQREQQRDERDSRRCTT